MVPTLFNIFWQNTIFHWTIILVFLLAAIAEAISIIKYWASIQKDLRLNNKIIAYLSKNLPTDENRKVKQLTPQDSNHFNWFQKYLVGTSKTDTLLAKVEYRKFVLIQYPAFFTRSIPPSYLRFVPTILIAIGVLGTFYGIQIGLSGISTIDLNNINQSTSNLLNEIGVLLAGMETAFSTSLMGLAFSSLFTILLATGEAIKRAPIQKLRQRLDAIAFVESPARVLSRLNFDASEKAATSLQETAETIKTSFTQLIHVQSQLNPHEIGRELGLVMTPIFQDIKQEIATLREIKNDQGQEILRNLITEQREQLIKPLIAEIRQSAQLTQQASQAVSELKQELGGISQSLSQSVNTIQQFQQDTLVKLQQFAVNLQSILSAFRSDTQGVMQSISTEIQSAVAASIQAIDTQKTAFETSTNQAADTFRTIREDLQTALHTQAEIERQMLEQLQTSVAREMKLAVGASIQAINAQKTAFETSASQAADTFRGIREDLQAALQTQAEIERQMLQDFEQRTVAIITTQTENITTVGNEASQLMDAARENLISSLGNIDTMLQDTRITVERELQRFRLNYQEALQLFFNRQNELLEGTLGKQRQGLAEVVNDLQLAFEEEYQRRSDLATETEQNITKIQETVNIVTNFANVIGLTSAERLEQIKEISRGLGEEASHIEKAYSGMIQQFNQALEMSNQHLVNYLEKASQSQNLFFTQADAATAKVSQQLLQSANYLVAAEANRRHQNNENGEES
jgi:hypothetical protein